MSVLDLRRCPICRTESCLVRQKVKLQGEPHVAYECLKCSSLLLWLGDDLWMQGDRWAYQKIGRADMEHLLQRSMTASDLRALASEEPAPGDGKRAGSESPVVPPVRQPPQMPVAGPVSRPARTAATQSVEPRAAERPAVSQAAQPNYAQEQAPALHAAASTPPEPAPPAGAPGGQPGYATAGPGWIPEQPGTWGSGAQPGPVYGPYQAWPQDQGWPQDQAWPQPQTAMRRRGRGSPLLMLSVALALLCLIVSAAAMIASTLFTGQSPLAIRATQAPLLEPLPSQTPVPTAAPTAVEAPAPTGAAEPVPTETPQPVPAGAAEPVPSGAAVLQLQGVTEHVAPTGAHTIVGEVRNTTSSNLWFVQILATFYDANGQVIGGGATFTELSIVEAGSSAPFKLATLDPPPDLATYRLSVDYQTTDQSPVSVELVEYSSYSDEAGGHHIVGDVRNNHVFAVKFPEIIATYYNASHDVIRVEMALSQLTTIEPGQTSPFEVVLADPPPELHHYALQTAALRQ